MNITWQILLSYNASLEFYHLQGGNYDFTKIQQETHKFRTSLLVLLIESGATGFESYVESTMLFNITLEQGNTPIEYYQKVFLENFSDKKDFRYMIQCAITTESYKTFGTNNTMSLHSSIFQLDVEKANALLPVIKQS